MNRPPRKPRKPSRPAKPGPAKPSPAKSAAAPTAWQDQAVWYDARHGERGDDLHSQVVLPAVLRRLRAKPGQRVIDCCCGQGVLARLLAAQGVEVTAIDAASSLIDAARAHGADGIDYQVADARSLDLPAASADHAAVVLALQDLDPIDGVLRGLATAVKPGGNLVIVLTHPCFRIPKQARFGYDEKAGVQYRRVDAYLQPQAIPITTHPGQGRGGPKGREQDAQKAERISSTSFHRPVSSYLEALGQAGWAVTGCEELCTPRRGTPGKRAEAEERAAREFPVFLLLSAVRLP
ncbi:MAG: class I SAM-dependent methyltransferase [Planctomycetota bacterium]|jgi:SAM-dependent methyltransferase